MQPFLMMQSNKNTFRLKWQLSGMIILLVCSVFPLFSLASGKPKPRNFYFSAAGSNANSGISPSKAWKTVSALANVIMVPGDSFLFHAKDTFSGSIILTGADSGTPAQPIVFASYGGGRAHINAGDSFGFFVFNVGGIAIKDLDIYGSGSSNGALINGNGIDFFTSYKNGHKFKYISVENVDIHGFSSTGLVVGSWDSSYPGFKDIRIIGVNSYDNKKSGFVIYDGAGKNTKLHGHSNLFMDHCVAYKNGLVGIVIGGVDSGVVEKCRSSYTGSDSTNGVSIMVSNSKNVKVQYCISDHIIANGPDGEGFDLDGGCERCVIQYCYAFQNYGYGFMFCDYPQARRTHSNVIRYCISENDGRKPASGQCSFLFNSWGTGLDSCYMYNNSAYNSDNGAYPVAGFAAYVETGYDSNPHFSHCFAYNNSIYMAGKNANSLVAFWGGKFPIADSNIFFEGNNYYAANSNSMRWTNNTNTYFNLAKWQSAAGQEIVKGAKKGSTINPSWLNPGKGGTMLDPDSLAYLNAYKLSPLSALIGKGLNIDSLLPFKNVPYDFYGDTLYPLHRCSLGADEPQPIHYAPKANFMFANACAGDSIHFKDSSTHAQSYQWNFGDSLVSASGTDTSSQPAPLHLFTRAGKYKISLFVTSLYGKTDSIYKTINIYSLPLSGWTETHKGEQYHFKANDTTLSYYHWSFSDSKDTSDSAITEHTFSRAGMMVTSLVVTDSLGCSAKTSDSVFVIYTAINNNASLINLKVSPDPFSNQANICYQLPSALRVRINICDITGQQLIELVNCSQEAGIYSLPIPTNLATGVYLVKLQLGETITDIKKIIKIAE